LVSLGRLTKLSGKPITRSWMKLRQNHDVFV
jgi:hypothetical protein